MLGAVSSSASPPAGAVVAAVVAADGVQYHAPDGSSITPQLLDSDPLPQRYALVRCAVELVLEVPSAPSAPAPSSQAISAAFEALETQICSPETLFLVTPSCTGTTNETTRVLAGSDTVASLGGSWQQAVTVHPAMRTSTSAAYAAPTASFDPGHSTVSCASLQLDVLAYVPHDTPAAAAAEQHVKPALLAQLREMRGQTVAAVAPVPLRALHFFPPGLAHHVTIVYPLPTPCIEADEAALTGRRAALHALLGLPADRPMLRVANAVQPGSAAGRQGEGGATQQAKRLSDVHVGAAPSGVPGGQVHLVQGSYDYYHYMQDRMDDSG